MKLVSFALAGTAAYGITDGSTIALPAPNFLADYPTLRAVIGDPDGLARLRAQLTASSRRLAFADVDLLPPIVDPAKVICIGINYETHRNETGRSESAYPAVFLRFSDTQIGHGTPIVRPRASTALDYEGELAVIIGRPGRAIAQADALEHVAGYACYNDASIRDWQRHTHQFTPGKNFPQTGAFGPWLVTADELDDPTNLRLVTRLNGMVVQAATTADMIFSIADIIAYVSTFTPLAAGDVIATGTPGGVGFKREPPLWMRPGDVVEVEIDGVGTLRNVIVDEADAVRRAQGTEISANSWLADVR
jgi:2-keto-4-pentenoate hydratase/2-oxohepta-3-ene-1,7-dioic acid hydratase in catechol pathway